MRQIDVLLWYIQGDPKKEGFLNLELLEIGTSEKGGVKTNRKRRPEMIRFQNIKVFSLIVPAQCYYTIRSLMFDFSLFVSKMGRFRLDKLSSGTPHG